MGAQGIFYRYFSLRVIFMTIRYIPASAPIISRVTTENNKEIMELVRYIFEELLRISQVINDNLEILRDVQHFEPAKRVTGMVKFFDGVDFNPGAGGGLYVYNNNRWEKI